MGTRGDPLGPGSYARLLDGSWRSRTMLELNQMPTAGHGFPSREAIANYYAELSGVDKQVSILFGY